jgi:hypothetical protein
VKIHYALGLNLFFHSAIYNCKCAYLSFGNSTPPQFASAQWSLLRLWQLENEEMEAAWQVPVKQSLRNLQRCGSTIATFPSEKRKMTIKKSFFCNWQLIQNIFIAYLTILLPVLCQTKDAQLAIRCLNTNYCTRLLMEGLSKDVGRADFFKKPQSDKLLQNMVFNTTQHPPPPPQPHSLYIL